VNGKEEEKKRTKRREEKEKEKEKEKEFSMKVKEHGATASLSSRRTDTPPRRGLDDPSKKIFVLFGPRAGGLGLAVLLLGVAACTKKPNLSPGEVKAVRVSSLAAGPSDAAWASLPVHVAPLVPQDMVEPRLLKATTPEVRVRAMHDGTRVAFLLEWVDASKNDLPGPARFADACAVQLPAAPPARDLPAPQMGEKGRGVEITYWRASWQAVVDGRGDTLKDLYPNATVDHYPFQAASLAPGSPEQKEAARRYAPARALGNAMAGPREKPVEDLVAEGPGTLAPGPATGSNGKGVRTATGWSVVLSRRLPPGVTAPARSEVAFAVWDGADDEAGARKMRTVWIPLNLEGTP
jgi:DMSO reductase family type II enzyme heme b subunit